MVDKNVRGSDPYLETPPVCLASPILHISEFELLCAVRSLRIKLCAFEADNVTGKRYLK